jgi:hypothetical protein
MSVAQVANTYVLHERGANTRSWLLQSCLEIGKKSLPQPQQPQPQQQQYSLHQTTTSSVLYCFL